MNGTVGRATISGDISSRCLAPASVQVGCTEPSRSGGGSLFGMVPFLAFAHTDRRDINAAAALVVPEQAHARDDSGLHWFVDGRLASRVFFISSAFAWALVH